MPSEPRTCASSAACCLARCCAAIGWRGPTRYAPGGGQRLLGGDFYDAVELDDGTVRLVVGDVCGHGPDEAAVGVAMRVAWRTLVLAGVPPDELLHQLEMILARSATPNTCSPPCAMSCSAPISAGAEVRLAGHPGPSGSRMAHVGPRGARRARARCSACSPCRVARGRGAISGDEWTWMLYTDGLVEGRDGDPGERLDMDGLAPHRQAGRCRQRGRLGRARRLGCGSEASRPTVAPWATTSRCSCFSPEGRWRS